MTTGKIYRSSRVAQSMGIITGNTGCRYCLREFAGPDLAAEYSTRLTQSHERQLRSMAS